MLRSVKILCAALFAILVLAALPVCAFADGSPARVSMYRMYNPNSGEHFYTSDGNERDSLVSAGWNYEGWGWIAPVESSAPVYRLYSGTDHHYTMDENEAIDLMSVGWSYEGIGWYSDDAQGVPLYRQFNPNVDPTAPVNNSGSHNYTTSKSEDEYLASVGWNSEGIGWYGVDGVELHHASVKVQGYDAFTMTIDSSYAPISAANFMDLANSGYYNGRAFYRIQDGFCLQGGTKGDTASGHDSSLTPVKGEFSSNGCDYNLLADNFQKGTVALARTSNPDSATSTFFVTLSTSTYTSLSLDGQYAAFATIDEAGMQTVDKLCSDYMAYADQSNMGTITDQAHKPIIESVTILD